MCFRWLVKAERFGQRNAWLAGVALLFLAGCEKQPALAAAPPTAGIEYTNSRMPGVPWSIHVVRISRSDARFEIQSHHAGNGALGLERLSDQVAASGNGQAVPIAAINGDFYRREGAYAGEPRSLQIVDSSLISAPLHGVCFWIDEKKEPHAGEIHSACHVIWPNGSSNVFTLNEERSRAGIALYTPEAGASTHTRGGRELLLEPENGGKRWAILGENYRARVREVRDSADSALAPGSLVLSIGPGALASATSAYQTGAWVTLVVDVAPLGRGARAAIGGGPVLLRSGKRVKIASSASSDYAVSSMTERHPRTAIGWNDNSYYLIEVDGRQRNLSAGMTLEELADYCLSIGCRDAMNLDGGGSATLWYDGRVRNSPCDGRERPIANSLVVRRKSDAPRLPAPTTPSP